MVYPDYTPGTRPGREQFGSYSEGLASISSIVKLAGHEVELFHMTSPTERGAFRRRIVECQPDVVGFATRSSNFDDVVGYASWAREVLPGVPLVAGGYHATVEPTETLLKGGFDFVLVGEADFSFLELCESIMGRRDYGEVSGLVYLKEGGVRENPVTSFCEDLDMLPFPDLDLFDVSRLESFAMRTLPAILSRGCPYDCTYCCNSSFRLRNGSPKRYLRFRSPENSIEYLKRMLRKAPDAGYVNFMDNILPLKRNWFYRFAELYVRYIGLPYSCNARADLFTEEIADAMKDSGCYRVHFGVESGDPRIREAVLNRFMGDDRIARAFELCHKKGIATLAYNMVGLPGETLEKVWTTVELNARLRPSRVLVPTFYPYPGTAAHELAAAMGHIAGNVEKGTAILDQPEFRKEQVVFASMYFRPFVRALRITAFMPAMLKAPLTGTLKWLFCNRVKPYTAFIGFANVTARVRAGVLKVAKERFRGLYLRVRDLTLGAGGSR